MPSITSLSPFPINGSFDASIYRSRLRKPSRLATTLQMSASCTVLRLVSSGMETIQRNIFKPRIKTGMRLCKSTAPIVLTTTIINAAGCNKDDNRPPSSSCPTRMPTKTSTSPITLAQSTLSPLMTPVIAPQLDYEFAKCATLILPSLRRFLSS